MFVVFFIVCWGGSFAEVNVANYLKLLEIVPFLIGTVGKDHFGSLLKEYLIRSFSLASREGFPAWIGSEVSGLSQVLGIPKVTVKL